VLIPVILTFSVNDRFHDNVIFNSGKNSIGVTELQTTSLLLLTIKKAFVLTFLCVLVILIDIGYSLNDLRIVDVFASVCKCLHYVRHISITICSRRIIYRNVEYINVKSY
jgi:hypothetical protein